MRRKALYENLLDQDEEKRKNNLKSGKKMCPRCDGTGNEFLTVFKQCTLCSGLGILRKPQ